MYPSFLERIFGSSPSAAANNSVGLSSTDGDSGASASAAPRLRAHDSTQYRATTRPYHCSQNHSSGLKDNGAGRTDADSFASLAMERVSNGSVAAFLNSRLSSSSSSSLPTGKSLKPVVSGPRGGSESHLPLTAPSGSILLHRRLPHTASGSSTGLDAMSASPTNSIATAGTAATTASSAEHVKRFENALRADPVDVAKLRELSWQGCPVQLRYEVWMFLTGCWSAQAATRMPTVSRRRIEYATYIHSSYGIVDWDAVCAMVDSGVDTAVRRSTLKAADAAGATPSASCASLPIGAGSGGYGAGEVPPLPPPELVIVASDVRPSLHASPLAPALASEKGGTPNSAVGDVLVANAAGASSLHLAAPEPRSSPHRLQRSSVSMEDVRSLLTQPPPPQQQQRNPENPLSPSLDASGLLADGSFASAVAANPVVSSMLLSGGDSRTFSTPTWPSLTATTTTNTNSATAGHQLSASTMLGSKELQTLKQIRKDIPRMSGGRCYLRHPRVQGSIERILFIWSLRHPACGYVQGMNDLVVPFMAVVLAYNFCPTRSITELHSYTEDIFDEIWSLAAVSVTQWINEIEAEVYWLTSYLLNTMQDNYTSSHEGITTMMRHLAAVVEAADPPLYHSMVDTLQLQFEHFSFRWMNCLLLRELTETQSLRLLDAYLSDEERRWSIAHVYVCAALLLRWSPHLLRFGDDYISALKFLQTPPTEQMSLRDFQDVLSESFVLQNLYEASLCRLVSTKK